MVRLSLVVLMAILLLGCSKAEKNLMAHYKKNLKYNKHLQKTEKLQLYQGNITKAMLTATYLYNPDTPKADEQFIIGLHLSDEVDEDDNSSSYLLTLNGKKANKVETLDNNDTRLKDISFVTEWGSYYIASFPHTKSKRFNLEFDSALYGKGKLEFAKVGKYIFTKESF
ncbi:MAG: hypothetical protein QM493_01330 [Sulfurovum sp.]